MQPYRYGILQPHRAAGAAEHNAAWLGPNTLGIEVTEPELAALCGLGNIDPQHLGGNHTASAIETAVSWPVPPRGAALVTVRLDADAVGAMAVLSLRANSVALSAETKARIALVGRSDRFDFGPWPGVRSLPAGIDDIDEVGAGPQNLGAVIGGLASPGASIDDAVRHVTRWLLTGEAPREWVARAEQAAKNLLAALEDGEVAVRDAVPGRIATVDGFAPGAARLGYRRAPVVVAVANLQDRIGAVALRKITIAQYRTGYVDLPETARCLSESEPGWGGSATIIGSPQGISCRTPVERCIDVLLNCRV